MSFHEEGYFQFECASTTIKVKTLTPQMFRQACSGCRDAGIIGGARLSTPIYNGPVTNPLQVVNDTRPGCNKGDRRNLRVVNSKDNKGDDVQYEDRKGL